MKSPLEFLQPLGRALMLPIAVLPVAGLLLRLGQPDLLNIAFVAAAGDAIFSNLGLLFAIGVAVGFAQENNGAAGLAGVVCFLIATEGAKALLHVPPERHGRPDRAPMRSGVSRLQGARPWPSSVFPSASLRGLIGGRVLQPLLDLQAARVPGLLRRPAFRADRQRAWRALLIAVLIGFGYDGINGAVDGASRAIVGSGEFGLLVYGFLNRILIVTGLHTSSTTSPGS